MPSNSEPGGKNESAPHAQDKPAKKSKTAKPKVPLTPAPPQSDGQKTPYHREITCKQADSWWERIKPFLEIAGVVLLGIYTWYTMKMYCANKEAANAATSAAKTAKDTLIASDRPWLIADVRLAGPLTFDKTGSAVLPVRYALKNTGHSPAIKAWSSVEMFLARNPQTEPNIEREKLCAKTTESSSFMGQAVFPTGAVPDPTLVVNAAVGNETIKKGQVIDGFINPTIILCVAYQTALDNNWHHTGMIFDVYRIKKEGTFAIKIGEDVPQDQLGFSLSFFHGVLAN